MLHEHLDFDKCPVCQEVYVKDEQPCPECAACKAEFDLDAALDEVMING